jgi:putative toxin-antitoxin system antitoxin component (TIGR02293 family)
MSVSAPRIASVLGGEKTLGKRIRSLDDLRRLVEQGLPVAALGKVVDRVAEPGAAAGELRYRIVPKATLHRRRLVLSLDESEKLERLARVTALSEDVWESDELAHEFLRSAQPQLGGERPLDLVRTELGARQVEDLLMKLEFGLPV